MLPRIVPIVVLLALGAMFALLPGMMSGDGELVLENGFVRATVDPARGGVITSMAYKKAMTFPLISSKGAGVAGSGTLFSGWIQANGRSVDLSTVAARAEWVKGKNEAAKVLKLTAAPAPGVALVRSLRMDPEEAGFRITDNYQNLGNEAIAVRVGSTSRQQPEPWRQSLRCWFGDGQSVYSQAVPPAGEEPREVTASSGRVFWRLVGQYGAGFLYQAQTPPGPAKITHALSDADGKPAEFRWQASEFRLLPGQSLSLESSVLIDEGGRQGNAPAALAESQRLIVTADLRAGGTRGEPVLGFGTVVSAVPQQVRMVVSQQYREAGRVLPGAAERVVELQFQLQPGKAQFRPFEILPSRKGLLYVNIDVFDQANRKLGSAAARSVIDGEGLTGEPGEVWKLYTRKMPEEIYRGTWAEIGQQIARTRTRIGPPTSPQLERGAETHPGRLTFYQKRFPYYAQLLQGASEVLKVPAERLARRDHPEPRLEACMDVFFNGPDGPLNAFSKERSGASLKGLGYIKVIPDQGYPFHIYMNYGVNSEGLSTSGATLNEDPRSQEAARTAAAKWAAAGKHVAPKGFWMWMLLATAKNVDEAIAFIENSEAPVDIIANLLLVDRAGNAARVESLGLYHQIYRYDRNQPGFLVAGNYPHQRPDGLFGIGADWGWAANTMLREKFLLDTAGKRRDQISLREAFSHMETHGAGGMCQHIQDNPARLYTSCSFIAVTRTSDLWLAHGPPCQVKYYKYSLGD